MVRKGGSIALWYRVVASTSQGTAPGQALKAKPRPFKQAIFLDGVSGVLGARGCVIARGQHVRGDRLMVNIQQKYDNWSHKLSSLIDDELFRRLARLKRLSVACFNCWNSVSTALFLAIMATSQPGLTGVSRTVSLKRRRILLRTTALPNLLPARKANRLLSRPLGNILRTSKG